MSEIIVHRRPPLRAWQELVLATGAPPCALPGWVFAWHRSFAPSSGLRFVEIRTARQTAALAPVLTTGRSVATPSNRYAPTFRLLAATDSARRLLTHALVGSGAHRLTASFLDAEDAATLAATAAARGYLNVRRREAPQPIVDLDGTRDAYLAARSPDHRSDFRGRQQALAEAGAVRVDVVDGSEGLEQHLEEMFTTEGSGSVGGDRAATAGQLDARAFYSGVARWAAPEGWLRLAFLRLDDRTIAFNVGLEYGDVFYHVAAGCDSAYERFSPGMLLHGALIERAFGLGLRRYELPGAGEAGAPTSPWATRTAERIDLIAFSPSLAGIGDWFLERAGRPVARRALTLVQR